MTSIPQIHTLSRASQLSLLAIVILLGAILFTVNSALQEQKQASHASGSLNFILNPSFESGKAGWNLMVLSPAAGTFTTTTSQHEDGAYAAQITTTSTSSTVYAVQLRYPLLPMQQGKTYTVSYWAKASANRQIGSSVINYVSPYQWYGGTSPTLTTSWKQYSFTFTAPATQPDVFVGFDFANATGTVWLDNVTYSEASSSTPTNPYSCSSHPTLQQGSTGVCVQRVQWFLNAKDNAGLQIDGIFGPLTYAAVRTFQTRNNLLVDGIVGPQTWGALEGTSTAPTPTNTPTPKPTVTPIPTLTCIYRPTCGPGIMCPDIIINRCILTPTTTQPTATPTPAPTAVPSPTPSFAPGSTVLNVTVGLQGIGLAGDNANPHSQGNMNPQRTSRTITADIYDSQNQLVTSQQATVIFDQSSGMFKGTIDLGTNFTSGSYSVKIKTDQYLRSLVPGIQSITSGQTTTLPTVSLISGDINGDNQINIIDYNILAGCYSDLLPAADCTDANKVLADLNDDGNVNAFDYNLFLRELSNVGGQ